MEYPSLNDELWKIMNNLADLIMVMFTPRVKNFNPRNFLEFATERKRTVKCGLETCYCCPQLWTEAATEVFCKKRCS